jgi:hypothetical protein
LGKEKSKHASLGQQDGCGLAFLHSLLAESQQSKAPAREECNKYDLTVGPCF